MDERTTANKLANHSVLSMTTRDEEIALEALTPIEEAHVELSSAAGNERRAQIREMKWCNYILHGAPFGKTRRGIKVWYTFRIATTDN